MSQENRFWRSLDEQNDSESARLYLARTEAALAPTMDETTRRKFLQILGASLALASVEGCRRQPSEKIFPYVQQPTEIVPGRPLYFATAASLDGVATGLLVESHMGRPTKIEGNPRHPDVPKVFWTGDPLLAPGVSDIFSQAAILTLYDPDRSQTVLRAGQISTWDAFITEMSSQLKTLRDNRGRGVRLLTETITSPSESDLIRRCLAAFPEARWVQFDPCNNDNAYAGAEIAFGRYVDTHYHLDKADVILSLDANLLVEGPGHLRHAQAFAARRDMTRSASGVAKMNRLYVVEPTLSLTGAKADHRLPLAPIQIEMFAEALAARLGIDIDATAAEAALSDEARLWLAVVADDLLNYRTNDTGQGVVVPGKWVSPRTHALAHAINSALPMAGKAVTYTEPVAALPNLQYQTLSELASEMKAGAVELLCILGGNPAYAAPADLELVEGLKKTPLKVRLGLYEDETSALCDWHIPAAHFLESWADARSCDGTVSLVQPLIAPLYDGKSAIELLSVLLDQPGRRAHGIVKEYWRDQSQASDAFEDQWQTALHEGIVPNTAAPALDVQVVNIPRRPQDGRGRIDGKPSSDSHADVAENVDLIFRPDPTIYDGRFANNAWLQELPKPFTKLTWDNAALIDPKLAERLRLQNGDAVEIRQGERILQTPVWIAPGQAEKVVTLHLGYGRSRGGRVATGIGVNAYALQSVDSPWTAIDVSLRSLGRRESLACTQTHHWMDGRDLVRSGTVEQARDNPESFKPREEKPATTMFPPHEYEGYKWAMTIDLNRCTGCNACVVACQAENNIPVVGKDQVERGREMHWIRVDTYYEGEPQNPQAVHQPLPCMHCENAPCEVVCPVGATVHDKEGLNEMIYNRCVGTRYCSNNCPYKVRRFNFLQYSDLTTPSLKLLRNPEVTVRNRGVMEKCTYCIQRISAARIDAEKRDRKLEDGQMVTACQAACPSQAITFGNLNESDSRVARLVADPLNYALLGELNTRPRTTYLPVVRNPNPQLLG